MSNLNNPPETPVNSVLPASQGQPASGNLGLSLEEVFPPSQIPARACSEQTCSAGHVWQPVLAITKCPGCASQMLVLKMLNCPICNEPASQLRLRTDHVPQGGRITPVCRGSASQAEIIEVIIEHNHAGDEQVNHKEREVISKL